MKIDNNRKIAYLTLMDIENDMAYSNIALRNHIRRGKPDFPNFVRELTYGTLKNKLYLDFILGNFVKTPVEKMKKSDLTILRMGLHQLINMNSVPEYAAINESVNLAKRYSRGHEGFINGVLRQYTRDKDYVELPDRDVDETRYLSLKYSYAPWIIELWMGMYEKKFVEALLEAGNKVPELSIRVNTMKTSISQLKNQIQAMGYEAKESELVPNGLLVKGSGLLDGKLFKEGLFSVQGESSQRAVEILDPKPGDVVIDVCAAPGGKTLAMAEKMQNQGQIYAWDIYKRKLSIVDREAERLGIDIIEATPWDATRVASDMIGTADKVLIDAPCTGLGVVRKKPEIKYKELSESLLVLPKKQLDILTASAKYLKPGGVLVYSTCTISRDENQKVVSEFLKKNKTFERQDTIQLLPNIDNVDGFFICKLKKSEVLL